MEPLRIAQPQQQQRRFSKPPSWLYSNHPQISTCLSVLTYPSIPAAVLFDHISQYPNLTLIQTLAEPNPNANPAST
jgi:hypothetical protein